MQNKVINEYIHDVKESTIHTGLNILTTKSPKALVHHVNCAI